MDFLEFAKKKNKVRNLSDICWNMPNYTFGIINEHQVKYNNYTVGDLVFVQKYKYKDGKFGNNHIFLIVDIDKRSEKAVYYGMLISSKMEKITYRYNKLLIKNSQNNLHKNSIIKTDVIYKIFTQNILLKIGNIDKTKVEIYKSYLVNNT